MRILWVKAGKLLPVDTGGKIRSYNLLSQLAKKHALAFLSYYGGPRDLTYEAEIAQEFPGAATLHVPWMDGNALRNLLNYFQRVPSPYPFAVTKFTAQEVREFITAALSERHFDVAICDFLSASLNFPLQTAVPVILFQHNIESELWARLAETESNWLRRAVYKVEAAKMVRYEAAAVGRFQHVMAVSDRDRSQMMGMTSPEQITVIPTGVNLEKYRRAGNSTILSNLVIFTGSMDWEPNIDGVEYFCGEIWPRVLGRIPDAKFRIVGRNPHARVQKLQSDSVEITGTVPSVIDHLKEAAAFVVPLRAGGGTRLKIYEAMAMGKAVVSTSIGAEGLDVHHGQDLLLCDDPRSFADGIAALLTDPKLREQLGSSAASLAARYDWSQITDSCSELFKQVAFTAEQKFVAQTTR